MAAMALTFKWGIGMMQNCQVLLAAPNLEAVSWSLWEAKQHRQHRQKELSILKINTTRHQLMDSEQEQPSSI